jgi:hypothetical protein
LPVDAKLRHVTIALESPHLIEVFDDGQLDPRVCNDLWHSELAIRPGSQAARSHLPMLWSWCESVELYALGQHWSRGRGAQRRTRQDERNLLSLRLDSRLFRVERSSFFHVAAKLRLLAATMRGVRLEVGGVFGVQPNASEGHASSRHSEGIADGDRLAIENERLPTRTYSYPCGVSDLLRECNTASPEFALPVLAEASMGSAKAQLALTLGHKGSSRITAMLDGAEFSDSDQLESPILRGIRAAGVELASVRACVSFVQSPLLGSWVHYPCVLERPELMLLAETAARRAGEAFLSQERELDGE